VVARPSFRRLQVPPPAPRRAHILDFFGNEAKLDIEVDGFQHGSPMSQSADAERDGYLASQGIKVLRFWSSRLRRDKEVMRETIWRTLQERAPHPLPDYCRTVPAVVSENRVP
jgi:very-short-patch-repair endonuclease